MLTLNWIFGFSNDFFIIAFLCLLMTSILNAGQDRVIEYYSKTGPPKYHVYDIHALIWPVSFREHSFENDHCYPLHVLVF